MWEVCTKYPSTADAVVATPLGAVLLDTRPRRERRLIASPTSCAAPLTTIHSVNHSTAQHSVLLHTRPRIKRRRIDSTIAVICLAIPKDPGSISYVMQGSWSSNLDQKKRLASSCLQLTRTRVAVVCGKLREVHAYPL